MAKILVVSFSNLKHDSRVRRQISFLKESHEVHVISFGGEKNAGYAMHNLKQTRLTYITRFLYLVAILLRRFTYAHQLLYPYAEEIRRYCHGIKLDVIIANDIETLPLAFNHKSENTKIVFDAHEYAPRHFEDRFWWRLFFQPLNLFLCKKFIPFVDGMITVGNGLAKEYHKNFGVSPVVITNATNFNDLVPHETSSTIRLIHHGILNRSRKIELTIDVLNYLPENFTLDLMMLIPGNSPKQQEYLEELKAQNKENRRLKFISPVNSEEVATRINEYDMGIILIPPINFNYQNCLPNKLFEYLQGRLAILTGPTPEIAELVNTFDLGVVANEFTSQSLANAIKDLTKSDIDRMKRNSHQAANKLSAEQNKVKLNELINSMLDQKQIGNLK